MDVLIDLYRQLIIDHNQNPHNFYKLNEYTHKADGHNPLCGDELIIYILNNNGIIKEISFTGSGCAISKASASIMTSSLEGLKIENAIPLFKNFITLATTGESFKEVGKLSALAGIYQYPARVKCATLAWHTFIGALQNKKEIIKTE